MFTSIFDDIKREFNNGNVIVQLIVINVAVFILYILTGLIIKLTHNGDAAWVVQMASIRSWLVIPPDAAAFIRKPWTLITHMFLHESVWHLVFNMYFLYLFGSVIKEYIGNRKLLPLYTYAGIIGGLFFLLSVSLFPAIFIQGSPPYAMGSSAAVLAVVVAAATLIPDFTWSLILIGPVRIKYIALFIVVTNLASALFIPDTGGFVSHLAGALFGYLFVRQLQAGYDWSKPFNNTLDWIKNLFSGRRQPRVVYKTKSKEPIKRSRPADVSADKQQRVDAILDKIARSGYDSLSSEEKEFLFKVSKDE